MDRAKFEKANQLEQEILWMNDVVQDIDSFCDEIKFYGKNGIFVRGMWNDWPFFSKIKKAVVDELKREIVRMEEEFDKL